MRTLLLCCVSLLPTACSIVADVDPAATDLADDTPAAEVVRGTDRHIALNHIALNHIALNGLIANFDANHDLTLAPLRSDSFAPGGPYPLLRWTLLNDSWAPDFMGHVISCALPAELNPTPASGVSFTDATGKKTTWRGDIGLCPAWADGPASIECQERVSACILARVNKLGQYVPISMRGDGLPASSLSSFVISEETDQRSGAKIAATQPCWPGARGFDDCGWRLERVITCTRDQKVKVGAGGRADGTCNPTVGSSGDDTVLRVTEGVRARNRGPAPAGLLPYAQWEDDDTWGPCGNLQPYIEFTCNHNGVYSVMSAPYYRNPMNTAVVAVDTTYDTRIGEPEQRVFKQPEGAFYGNIFRPEMLGVRVYFDPQANNWRVFEYQNQQDQPRNDPQLTVHATIFRDMWVCGSRTWTNKVALFHSRLCALPDSGEGCAATWVGTCDVGTGDPPACSYDDTKLLGGHGGWSGCRDGLGTLRSNVISTFLAGQCDTVPIPSLCGTQANPTADP